MNFVPQALRDQAKVLIEIIKNNENFILDKYGYLKVKSNGVDAIRRRFKSIVS